jgi:hypothetical protein
MLDLRIQADLMSAFSFGNLSVPSTPVSRISLGTEDEFHSPIEPSPACEYPRMWSEDTPIREVDQPVVWDGHTRIISGLNHLISMPAGPGWKELHIQPSDTLQVELDSTISPTNATELIAQGIALRYGTKVSDIRAANKLTTDCLLPRAALLIPPPCTVRTTVGTGTSSPAAALAGACISAAALAQPLFLLRTQRGTHRLIQEAIYDPDSSGLANADEWDRRDGFLCLQSASAGLFNLFNHSVYACDLLNYS